MEVVTVSKEDEDIVAHDISSILKTSFEKGTFVLSQWGVSERYVKLGGQSYLLLEVETSQKHPSTNVAKIWPYLEENPDARIFLIQAYFQSSPGCSSNRGKIATWLGRKMEKLLEGRFRYFRLVIDGAGRDKENQKLRDDIESFLKSCSEK